MSDARPDYNISALDSALLVLESFIDTRKTGQSLSEVVQAVGLNKSRVFRILATLQQHGYVEQDPDTRDYRLGLKLLELGGVVQRRLDVVSAARPALDRLAHATGETVFLGVVDGLETLCVDKRESQQSIRLHAEVGGRSPLHVGGVPKVLLAYLVEDDPAILQRLDLVSITPATITDVTELARLLAGIRRDGYVVTQGDLDWGAASIAAPIRDHNGKVVAAVSCAGPVARFTPERVERYVALVVEAAADVSRRLGYRAHGRPTAQAVMTETDRTRTTEVVAARRE